MLFFFVIVVILFLMVEVEVERIVLYSFRLEECFGIKFVLFLICVCFGICVEIEWVLVEFIVIFDKIIFVDKM